MLPHSTVLILSDPTRKLDSCYVFFEWSSSDSPFDGNDENENARRMDPELRVSTPRYVAPRRGYYFAIPLGLMGADNPT